MPFNRSKNLSSFDSRWAKGMVKLNETEVPVLSYHCYSVLFEVQGNGGGSLASIDFNTALFVSFNLIYLLYSVLV